MFIYVLITMLHVCFAAEVTTPLVWTNSDKTTEIVVFFPNLHTIMVERGNRIVRQITTHTGEYYEYKGRDLLDDIFRYNAAMEDANEFMLSEDSQEREAGLRVYNAILEVGGPQQLKITTDLEFLKTKFPDLKPDDIKGIQTSFDELKTLWAKWQEDAASLNN